MAHKTITVDGNEAAASVAFRCNEVIAIYPITPSSAMGELCDEWSARRRTNLWGAIPDVVEMQSEGGAIGAVHGALQAGALTTTFTSSQGLLLMIPNLYKIAGELTPFALHVAARAVATHALSIFGDHSDVMACRQTGCALLSSGSVQEAHDFACIAQAATLRSRVPFLHFFDGFRTSHEVAKIELLADDDLREMLDADAIAAHRSRALTPDRPVLRGTAQNPDTFFQGREAANPFYDACPGLVREAMQRFAERTGRRYDLFDYHGDPRAERVVVVMGSAANTLRETVDWLQERGERVGVLAVRLYRPFAVADFAAALPATTRAISVLDRTKEPGAVGEPLFLDVVAALEEERASGRSRFASPPRVIGGRYGLGSKEFTPAMSAAVFAELAKDAPMRRFTVGIVDDVGHASLPWDSELDLEPADVVRAVFYGLGSDGTVGANKNSIKIIGEGTPLHAQAYFVYDSKKSGAMTISHLRFGPRPIRSPYLIRRASFVACHHFPFLDKIDVLDAAAPGAAVLLNAPFAAEEVWSHLPIEAQRHVLEKKLRLFAIDADRVARESGLGGRINTVMQAAFFAISGVLPREEAIARIKKAVEKTYGKRGDEIVRRNADAIDRSLEHLHEIPIPAAEPSGRPMEPIVSESAPDLVRRVLAVIMAGHGDRLPVSAFPVDGTWPTGTAKWEKRNIAREIPVWDRDICIQCNKCALVCPHTAIRAKVYDPALLAGAPPAFKSNNFRGKEHEGLAYTIQVAPEDCTGCRLCTEVCPAKDRSNPKHKAIDMHPQRPLREQERVSYEFFLSLPEVDRESVKLDNKGSQLLLPLIESSGACAGCGETPYLKLLTQLFGDRLLIANATGCSSIYGGSMPSTPYTTNGDGRGPAWSNSLFEDNAEFGLGFRLAIDAQRGEARRLVERLRDRVGEGLARELLASSGAGESDIAAQRRRVTELRERLARETEPEARRLLQIADLLVHKSVWLVGGDGWAYDIGFGGLDHVVSLGRKVNVLILDTEVYSNTGGQQSKATPMAAAAKFATGGRAQSKKDLGLMLMSYGSVYVARVAFGASDQQTVKALLEAESYSGPSVVIAYSHCIAHGYDMAFGARQQKLAVDSGAWPLYRFDPRRSEAGEPPLQLDSGAPKVSLETYMRNETRFLMSERIDPERFRALMSAAQRDARQRRSVYEQLAGLTMGAPEAPADSSAKPAVKTS